MSVYTNPANRPRIAAHQIVTNGLARILQGVFGIATPELQMDKEVQGTAGYYHFHEGDLFTPGSAVWAADPVYDGPLNTTWGGGFLCGVNQFNPISPVQVYSNPSVLTSGPGGLVHGDVVLQPLFPIGHQNGQ